MKKIKVIARKILGIVVVLPLVLVGMFIELLGKMIVVITIGLYEDIETARSAVKYLDENFLEGFSEGENS